jgi:FHS family L-fucose permease-like MFS transporter
LLVERVGYKRGIIAGLSTAGVGCLLFYPAASSHSYTLFLGALFVLASGITLLQVAANPYVAILGTSQTAHSRLVLTQAFNSLGTTVGPYVGSILILSAAIATHPAASKAASAASVQGPYLALAATLFLIAVLFAWVRLPQAPESQAEVADEPANGDSVWGYRHLVLGMIAIFLYVGAEVSIGSFLVNFMSHSDIAGLPEDVAGRYLALYWGGAMVGRFIGAFVLSRVSAGRLLAFNASMVVLLLMSAMAFAGPIAMWSLLAVGLFNSIMFPTIFTLAIHGLGRHTGTGSGMLCMAIVGGAIMPVLQGLFADRISLLYSFIIPLTCYLYIGCYGWKWHEPKRSASEARVAFQNT